MAYAKQWSQLFLLEKSPTLLKKWKMLEKHADKNLFYLSLVHFSQNTGMQQIQVIFTVANRW